MPRSKKTSLQRDIGPDLVYKSELIHKFINVLMEHGKKNIARNIVYDAMDAMSKKVGGDKSKTLALFSKAFEQVIPYIEVRSRRVGGSVYQVPREVLPGRARALAIRWIIAAAKERSNKTMAERLAAELLDAQEGRGNAVKKKADVHRMAEANRAFSHYAW
jgi:small subunit ribosomal protein S7